MWQISFIRLMEGSYAMNNVLIIDDDKELCALMKKCVEQENLSAIAAYS